MIAQEIFDKVAGHLLQQNAKSLDNTGMCTYRGENGLKCAVGILIPDGEYSPNMEALTVNKLLETDLLSADLKEVMQKHSRLLKWLQMIHDDQDISTWKEDLTNLARESGLIFKF